MVSPPRREAAPVCTNRVTGTGRETTERKQPPEHMTTATRDHGHLRVDVPAADAGRLTRASGATPPATVDRRSRSNPLSSRPALPRSTDHVDGHPSATFPAAADRRRPPPPTAADRRRLTPTDAAAAADRRRRPPPTDATAAIRRRHPPPPSAAAIRRRRPPPPTAAISRTGAGVATSLCASCDGEDEDLRGRDRVGSG
jgi:hypothetical protein